MVQGLGLCAFTAEGLSSVSGWRTKIPQAKWPDQIKNVKKKKKGERKEKSKWLANRPQLSLSSYSSKVMLKILQARLHYCVN